MIWLSYEIINRLEVEKFKSWLQKKQALECCSNCVFIKTLDSPEELQSELNNLKIFGNSIGDRLYVIFKKDGKYVGRFLYGKRLNQ